MHITKTRKDEGIAVIEYRDIFVFLRQFFEDAGDLTVFCDQVAVRMTVKGFFGWCVHNCAMQNNGIQDEDLLICRVPNVECILSGTLTVMNNISVLNMVASIRLWDKNKYNSPIVFCHYFRYTVEEKSYRSHETCEWQQKKQSCQKNERW